MIIKTIIDKYRFYEATGQKIERLQLKKINHLFSAAKKYSKYYRKIFSELGINSIRSFKEFEKIPYLEREDLKKNLEDIKIGQFTCCDIRTSGSSGEPVTINRSRKSILRTIITGHPFFISRYIGSKIKSICLILIWGDGSLVEDVFEGNILRYLKLAKTSLSVLMPLDKIVDVLIFKRPELILTYPSFLVNLRRYLQKRNIKLDFLKLVVVSGELISPYFTEKNSKFFNCPVLNAYISTEGGLMGLDHVDSEGMYLIADNAYLEVVKNGKTVLDEEGDIVITELNNFATPLIRYKGLRDRGIISINNGRRYLKLISGRIIDDFITKGNVKICAYAITEIIESYEEVLKFKIIQESRESIKIYIYATKNIKFFRKAGKYYKEIKKEIEKIFKHTVALKIITGKEVKNKFGGIPFRILERNF